MMVVVGWKFEKLIMPIRIDHPDRSNTLIGHAAACNEKLKSTTNIIPVQNQLLNITQSLLICEESLP